MKGNFHLKRGFTMIEVMVVIVILGVLSGVAVPKVMGYTEKTKEKADVLKLYHLRNALNKALVEDVDALNNPNPAKKLNQDQYAAALKKLSDGLKDNRGATLFVIEVHNGLSVNVQDSHSNANNTYNVSVLIGRSGAWYDALKEAGFDGVADIVADRINGTYKKETSTYTSFSWNDANNNNKEWQRTAPKKPMFMSNALNRGKENANTRYTMSVRWNNPKNPNGTLEVYILPNGKNWNQAFLTDNGTCFSTYGPAGCNGK